MFGLETINRLNLDEAIELPEAEQKALSEIVRTNSRYVDDSNVRVEMRSNMPTVSIDGPDCAFFLQGEDAERFIKDASDLWNQAGLVTMEEAINSVALPYVDC